MGRPRFLGHGVGLRREHHERVLEGPASVDWLEAISENFMRVGGRARAVLLAARERYPVVLHGVSLSIGSTDALDDAYLDDLAELAEAVEPAWISDHLCWGGVGGHSAHDLLPLPYTQEALRHVVDRVRRVQDRLGRRIALENVSSYMAYRVSEMPEWEFLSRVAEGADCGILLDVNNVFVSSVNHRFDPRTYIRHVAATSSERVWQLHMAGHSQLGELLLDTHDHAVPEPVWELFDETVALLGPVSTLIEWDDHIPPFDRLQEERDTAARRHDAALARRSTAVEAARGEAA